VIDAIKAAGIGRILCLTGPAEIARKSPGYAAAIAAGTLPCPVVAHPLEDFATPADAAAFAAWISTQAADLRAGTPMLLHCAAGIGRTGTVALCLLHALGIDQAEALVAAAGSQPETPEQRAFVARFRSQETPA
jgi:hypothetical protein